MASSSSPSLPSLPGKGGWAGIALGSIAIVGFSAYNVYYFWTRKPTSVSTNLVDINAQRWINIIILVIAFLIFLVAIYELIEFKRRATEFVTAVSEKLSSGASYAGSTIGGGLISLGTRLGGTLPQVVPSGGANPLQTISAAAPM